MIKSPKYFRDVKLQQINYKILLMIGQHQNPLTETFYKRVFGMTYAEKKAQEDAEYFYYDENGKKKEVRKSKEETQSIH